MTPDTLTKIMNKLKEHSRVMSNKCLLIEYCRTTDRIIEIKFPRDQTWRDHSKGYESVGVSYPACAGGAGGAYFIIDKDFLKREPQKAYV